MFSQTSVCPQGHVSQHADRTPLPHPLLHTSQPHTSLLSHTPPAIHPHHTHSAATQPPVTHPHPGTLLCHTPPVTNTLLPRSRGGHRSEWYASFSNAFFFGVILTRCLELISFRRASKQSTLCLLYCDAIWEIEICDLVCPCKEIRSRAIRHLRQILYSFVRFFKSYDKVEI